MRIIDDILNWLPDEQREVDTPYDGLLSYAREWHASAIGAGTGITAAGLLLSGTPVAALLAMGSITVVALKLEFEAEKNVPRIRNKKVRAQIRREPWYAIGFMVAAFLLTVIAEYAFW